MWGILSHIKYGRHRGTMAKTIVSRETRRQSSISYDSSSLTSSLFFSPPPLQFWKNFLISDSDLATTRQHFRCFLLFFSCFSAQWIKWCYRRYRRRYQSRARASFNKKKKKRIHRHYNQQMDNNKEEPANRQHFQFFHVGKLMLLITVSVKKRKKKKNNTNFLEIVYLESSNDHFVINIFSNHYSSISYLLLKSIRI